MISFNISSYLVRLDKIVYSRYLEKLTYSNGHQLLVLSLFQSNRSCPRSCLSKWTQMDHMLVVMWFITTFIFPLGQGTTNLAKVSLFLFGLKWCVDNGHTFILGETNLPLLQNCINESLKVPRRIHEEG